MHEALMTFGQAVAEARKKACLNQRELANLIRKEDGEPISQPYLNDIEHDRRNPPSDALIEQFAAALKVPSDILYYWAGRLPPSLRHLHIKGETIVAGFDAFRKATGLQTQRTRRRE
jgi:transcriptional regulator with XRE-family HTH domain